VLAAPLMDVSRLTDTTNLSPSGSNTVLPQVNTPSADAETIAVVAGPSPRGPPTPLLIAVGPSKPLMMPDLHKLFGLYYHDHTKPKVANA